MSDKIIEIAQEYWHTWKGLLLSIAASSLILSVVLGQLKSTDLISVIAYLFTAILVSLVWYFANLCPKTEKGKLGFVVSIRGTSDAEQKKISDDFIYNLRSLLKRGPLGKNVDFIEISKNISSKINDIDDAQLLRAKTKAKFLIYGRIRIRKIDGNDCNILELEGIVSHADLPKEVSEKLANEFGELFPRRVNIKSENDLFSFNFTTEWTEVVAKYVIGIASALSGDLDYAEVLYKDVQQSLEVKQTDFPVFEKLKNRIPKRITEINKARSNISLNEWRKTHDKNELEKFISSLDKVDDSAESDYGTLLLKGIKVFLCSRDVDLALSYVQKCKKIDDPIWHFNSAFLHAYKGDLAKAIREYRICSNYDIAAITISQVESFLVWIIEEEPDKYQFYYCLGFFNWKIKGDEKKAVEDFQAFLKYSTGELFTKEVCLARKWIGEIEEE
ncbi:hypothetical protein SAMN02745165_02836 [Malonomonas rubra DSM 5091]|uniref:Tetratricopeptide repeat-containing protein n=1 Tax=Malonomonas rubra DSM 5091 TaxID=1122189 RepID=A0A1M6KXN1_MALRU|nr:hypothetical protein [Malonomonas rubra]SHJ63717.1 hypothetical protein SAMN02745165_02836 [Malonomonas rubra DSM 5091]